MANSLEMPAVKAELTLEQQRDQLLNDISELVNKEKAEQEKIEFEDSGKYPLENYKSFTAIQNERMAKDGELEALNKQIESPEDTRSPEQVTAAKIVEEKFSGGKEAGFLKQNERAQQELEKLEAKIAETQKNIDNSKLEDEKLGLKFILLGYKKKAENIREGLKLHEERDENLEKAA